MPDEPGLLASSVTTLRLIAGWACVALGVLNLAMGLTSFGYVVFHVVVLIAGLLLLGVGRHGRSRTVARLIAGAVAGLGLVGTALPATAVECCSRGYAVRHGFPFTMLARDPGGWRLDAARTVADLIFWACVGTVVLALVARLTPARPAPVDPGPAPAAPAPGGGTHAEQRAAAARAAHDENVGGLP